jgi:hypothetical protein
VLTVVEHDLTAFSEQGTDADERVESDRPTRLGVARARLVSTIEALTDRRVTAVITGSHADSSSSFEVFLLEEFAEPIRDMWTSAQSARPRTG